MSDWNDYLDRKLSLDLNLEESRLADAIARNTLGWHRRENEIGQKLLREEARLHGRSFDRAREGLIAAGLVRYAPGSKGRGRRDRYLLLLDEKIPAPQRAFSPGEENPAPERAFSPENPAQNPAQNPAVERVRSKKGEELHDDEVGDRGELEDLLAPFGDLTSAQHATVEAAWNERPEGVHALANEARGARVRSRTGLFMSRINDGAHRTIKAKPPFAALVDTPAPNGNLGVCPECEIGGGLHIEGCPAAKERTP
jgi:hypothetical protein